MSMVAALDIGGTKVHGAIVDAQGRILTQEKLPVLVSQGQEAFFGQLIELLERLIGAYPVRKVGLGCAGPLNGRTGELLDPTNFKTDGRSWGRISLLRPLQSHFPGLQFVLENDAAAAVLGEHWLGEGKTDNIAVMTLGTGIGLGVIVDGRLLRSRDGLHPEIGHIPLNMEDTKALCCGKCGCIEAYLAAPNFVRRVSTDWNQPDLNGPDLVARAQGGEERALKAFEVYGDYMAHAIKALCVMFGSEVVAFTGGFAHSAPLFLPRVEKRLPELLKRYREGFDLLPRVKISSLGDRLGVLGAARVALLHKTPDVAGGR